MLKKGLGGLNIGGEELQYERISLDAGREKKGMQRTIDDMLFGKPVVRKTREQLAQEKEANAAKKTQSVPPPVPQQPTKTAPVATKPANPPMQPALQNNFTQVTKISESITQKKTVISTLKVVKTETKKESKLEISSVETNTIKKETTSGVKAGSPRSKVSSVPVPQINMDVIKYDPVQVDTAKRFNLESKSAMLNKPGYIRKLRKIAEDFKFQIENAKQNHAVDVVRIFETDEFAMKKNDHQMFTDKEFPPSRLSLGPNPEAQRLTCTWTLPEVFSGIVFGKYVDPNDIQPGPLSCPEFLSTLSVLAELEINTKRLIQDQKKNENGFYQVRIFVNSVWRYINVDSFIPFYEEKPAGATSFKDAEWELSVALIEKAYAKAFGGYHIFSSQIPRENYLRDLTGAPTRIYSPFNADFVTIVKKAAAAGQPMLAVGTQKLISLGLNPNYSFNVINFNSKGSLELRNSWSTVEERPKATLSREGVFQIASVQVADYISHIIVSQVNPTFFTSTIQAKHNIGQFSAFKFEISRNTRGFFSISQWDERMFPKVARYYYSPFKMILFKNQKETSDYISAATSEKSRNTDMEVALVPGFYTIYCIGHWRIKQYDFNLTFYGSEEMSFSRQYGDAKITKDIAEWSKRAGILSSMGRVNQWILYHEASNILTVTFENSTEDQVIHKHNFGKIDLSSLNSLILHESIQNLNVKLAPFEVMTWVFSREGSFSLDILKILK